VKKLGIIFALLWTMCVRPAAAYDDIYAIEGLGYSPSGGLPVFIPPGTVLTFDWTLTFSGLGPGGTSAGIDEGLELLKISDANPNSYFRLWSSDRVTVPRGAALPPPQSGHAVIDLSQYGEMTIRLGFHVWFTSSDLRDDSSAFISGIQLTSVPEPGTGAIILLSTGILLWRNRARRISAKQPTIPSSGRGV
jgi:hypothetical protein